jgi:triacylglycerol lipase
VSFSDFKVRPLLFSGHAIPSCLFVVILLVPLELEVCAIAQADESQYAQFYTPPDPLPGGRPGDVIRFEPSRLVLEPSGQLGTYVATGTRIMYLSTAPF